MRLTLLHWQLITLLILTEQQRKRQADNDIG